MVTCTLDYEWPTHVVASLILLVGGLIIMLLVRYVCRWSSVRCDRLHGCRQHLLSVQEAADVILSGDSLVSKIFICGLWLVDVAAIVVYLVEGTLSDPLQRDKCGSVRDDWLEHLWISLMCISAIRFLIKFCAAKDKIRLWIELESVAEYFTVVPTFVSIYYDRNWLGLGFLRLIHLVRASDVLQLLHIVKNRMAVRLTWAASVVATVWMCGACVFYMLETNGDPWTNYSNADSENVHYFWDYIYFVLVTLTTIGFGDMSPYTTLGKAFLIFYVLLCLATFGKLLPELADIFDNRSRFRKPYRPTLYRHHLVICGGLTFETLKTIVKSFVHHDWTETNVGMVVVDRNKPSIKLQSFFRRHFNNVTFIEGTVLDISTLKLAKVKTASAVLILANRCAENADDEDAANIMRATAIKNFREDTRIIIQLLQYRNKERLLHIPSWSWHGGDSSDEVICISELKMSIVAQNCLAPGIVTLLANLIKPHHFKRKRTTESWLDDYLYGFTHVIYTQTMSDAFDGMTFTEAAELCYRQFGVVLIAVDCCQTDGWTKLRVNPADAYRIQKDQVGFFIARARSDVRRVAQFTVEQNGLATESNEQPLSSSSGASGLNNELRTPHSARRPSDASLSTVASDSSDVNNNDKSVEQIFDPTGMYYWCPPCSLDEVLLDAESVREHNLANHIILIFGAPSATTTSPSRSVGLRNFLSPLRASSIRPDDIKTVVFCVSRRFIEPEWNAVANFPKVFVFARTNSLYSDLRALNIRKCAMCIVKEANDLTSIDDKLVDTSTVHTTTNIHSLLNIDSSVGRWTAGRRATHLLPQVSWSVDEVQCHMYQGDQVQMLVQLEYDDSVAYVDNVEYDSSRTPIQLTLPYVCGQVMLTSVLDSLVTMAYMNSNLMRLFRALITGGELTDLEKALGDGLGVFRRHALADVTSARNRSIFVCLGLNEHPLDQIGLQHDDEYGRLVVGCLQSFGLLCLGLYRLLLSDTNQRRQKRYVITNPPSSFRLLPSDKVYALKPFEFQGSSSGGANQPTSSNAEQQTAAVETSRKHSLVSTRSNGETGV